MKIVRFSQNGHAPRLGCYLDQDQVLDLAATCAAYLSTQGVIRATAIAEALFPQSTRGFLEAAWRPRRCCGKCWTVSGLAHSSP